MSDFSNAKGTLGGIYPINAIETPWSRTEPLVTPQQVKDRYLFGIPLVSGIKDPLTGKAQVFTEELIQDTIVRAVSTVELDTAIDIFPVHRKEKYPWDRNAYQSLGYLNLAKRPVSNLLKLTITPSNGTDVYVVPLEWVETAYIQTGQINIIPLTAAFHGGNIPSATGGGVAFIQILGTQPWIAAWWQAEYVTGFPDGNIPRVINEVVGMTAAIEILSQLAATLARSTSKSLSIDGTSQGISGPGPQIYTQRITDLQERRQALIDKIKTMYGNKVFASYI